MPVARIVAKDVDNDRNKFILLASLNNENKIISGEWLGYFISVDTDGREKKYPFIMDDRGTLWFDQEHEIYSETTNLLDRTVFQSEYFCCQVGNDDECTYKIFSVILLP